ncbi:phage protease [Sedimentitalea sp. JM2-8]|uniref:Phage protease n=1 Tax=Sedimentitalea xiamensis TaxID=3050037 RepID=A0ABT7FLI3_9RHOB|nr:phage protease [Sedimentitalea xiamensis]MDK3075928.1 phage protease [Sedimentitalea xiamensis]
MAGSLTAICDRDLGGSAPEWVHLFPVGQMTGRDGRRFNLANPQMIVDAFRAGAVDLPVDYEHQSDAQPEQRSGPVPAAGWIKELRVGEDGIWGRVEWTAQARGLIALARQETAMNEPETLLDKLIAALGLPEETTEDELIALIETIRGKAEQATAARMPDPARFVPIEAVQDLMASRHADLAERTKERATAKVKDALARGFITPAMKDWATALCAQDEASFDRFVATSVPAYAHLMKQAVPDGPPPSSPSEISRSDAAAAVCAQLGLKPDALKE